MRIEDLVERFWDESTQLQARYRCTLLAHALPEEMVGDIPEKTDQTQQAARQALKAQGVWDQILDELVRLGLMEEKTSLADRLRNWLTSKSN